MLPSPVTMTVPNGVVAGLLGLAGLLQRDPQELIKGTCLGGHSLSFRLSALFGGPGAYSGGSFPASMASVGLRPWTTCVQGHGRGQVGVAAADGLEDLAVLVA